MANAKKCDRCGKLYEFYEGVEFTPGGNRYVNITLGGDRIYDERGRFTAKCFDLCQDCMQQVVYFLNNEGNTYVQCRDCKHEENGINDTPCVSCKRINKGPEYDTDYYEYDEKKEGE